MIQVVSALLGFYTISWLPFMVYEFLIMSCDPDQQDCDDYRYFRSVLSRSEHGLLCGMKSQ